MTPDDVSIRLRQGTPADAALLAELGARTFHDAYVDDIGPSDMTAYLSTTFGPDIQAAELADPATWFLIAEVEGKAIGYAKLHANYTPEAIQGMQAVRLARLYVDQAWIGHGIGARLMQASLDEAHRRGFEAMWLEVWEHNYRAQAFYEKWGFSPFGTNLFQFGSDQQTDLQFLRQIRPVSEDNATCNST